LKNVTSIQSHLLNEKITGGQTTAFGYAASMYTAPPLSLSLSEGLTVKIYVLPILQDSRFIIYWKA
jgi:hypothetical protein